MIGRTLKRGGAMLSVIALAAAFTAAPAVVGHGPLDAAAHAKGGNGNGNGKSNAGGKGNGAVKSASAKTKTRGGGNGNGSASARGKGRGIAGDIDRAIGRALGVEKQKKRTTRTARGNPKSVAPETEVEELEVVSIEEPPAPLTASQKGKWNAANANQRALDVHIRNEKYNGTIGALSYYQLAGKAASGAELNEYEQRALDNILADYDSDIPDDELEMLLNTGEDGDPVYDVTDGVASCTDNCADADVDGANDVIAGYYDDAARLDFLADAEQRILDDSNKPTDGIEDQLLDELAMQLGFERYDPEADMDPEDEEVIVVAE